MSKDVIVAERTGRIREQIPHWYDLLVAAASPDDSVIVIYHDFARKPEYGLMTLRQERWVPSPGSGISRGSLIEPLRQIDRRYRERGLVPSNIFIAIDVRRQRAWFSRSFSRVRRNTDGPHLDESTLAEIPATPSRKILTGDTVARLAPRAQVFTPGDVPHLARSVSLPQDVPEESFLLHQELLQLAVDTLRDDEQLDSIPVHVNALWVFARPVVMLRPDGTERYVRAVWYRQGEVMWRIRTYAAGRGKDPKEVGERLAGRLPFVPVWDEHRAEQKLLAAVWALMEQGDVTESETRPVPGGNAASPSNPDHGPLHVVRVKAGTDHAEVYRDDAATHSIDRPAWSVRGHWRRQPYPSLGVDDAGNVLTKMIWIASYTKGDATIAPAAAEKVIVVRS
ncbi:hypothetical protein DEJ27_13210 [Curtobacterium sp. MCPF17_018]|uniref:hypothetical protein n=1 Tax=Curtobacterium sp. MCPF17_018 TaxID=2175638 RepID=UPI000DA747C9|nr:hypothetical protein [Curtobacterium sp. MCPF17_018]PZE66839.1 hypothetical protein DEJ27_13210 [Curtobacterium sp. MCPF17_018]